MTAEQLRSRAPWRLLDRRPWVLALCLCFFARASLRAGQVPDAFRRMPHGPQLPSATVRELLQITAGGVSDRELPRLRDTVVGALALLYRAQAARGAGDAWEEGAFNDFWSWLEKQGKLYPTLTLAIHPRDRVSNVFQVVDVLRRSFPREVEEWPHLVVAYAVVWDEPAAVKGVRDGTLWGGTRWIPRRWRTASGGSRSRARDTSTHWTGSAGPTWCSWQTTMLGSRIAPGRSKGTTGAGTGTGSTWS